MRSERAVLTMLLDEARQDERIRAVYMNGSRVNPNARKDILRDYDVVFVVTELAPYLEPDWIDRFGEILILQEPDKMDVLVGQEHDFSKRYAYLMQFADGVRIDLTLELPEVTLGDWGTDTLTRVLLDKDGRLPELPPPSEASYYAVPPTQALFDRCHNEFWWVLPYVAKALWRGQILYAMTCLNGFLRREFMDMVAWYAAMDRGFQVNLGKGRDGVREALSPEQMRTLLTTHPPAEEEAIWKAVDAMAKLFESCAMAVSERMGFVLNAREAANGLAFVRHVRALPRDAQDMDPIHVPHHS